MEMDDKTINDKHRHIRGSDDLKYPGNQSRCRSTCGHYHDEYHDHEGHLKYKEHRCFLAIGHREEFCEFSSVCSEKRVRPRKEAVTLNVDGVAA